MARMPCTIAPARIFWDFADIESQWWHLATHGTGEHFRYATLEEATRAIEHYERQMREEQQHKTWQLIGEKSPASALTFLASDAMRIPKELN